MHLVPVIYGELPDIHINGFSCKRTCRNCTIRSVKVFDVSDDVEIVCEFKRGGMCISHRIVGTKYVETWKEWTKMKNGLYGYVNRRKTKYVCRFRGGVKSNCDNQKGDGRLEGVAESNCDNLVLGMDRTTMSSIEALGGTCIDKGAMYSGISGGDLRQAGCNTSESEGIETTLKENG